MNKFMNSCAILAAVGLASAASAQVVIVDLSPDATGVSGTVNYFNGYGFPQTIGDVFTLTSDAIITGMSIYTVQGGVNGTWGVGSLTDVAVYADAGGMPGAAVILEQNRAVDAYDTQGGTIDGSYRSFVSLNTPTFLPAGTYYLTMPGVNDDPGAWGGNYDDNGLWAGFDGLPDLEGGFFAGAGDMFLQIEAVPAPGTLALIGLGGLFASRRRR